MTLTADKISNDKKSLTNFFSIINTPNNWSAKTFYNSLEDNLIKHNCNCKIIDFSIVNLISSTDFKYSKLLGILLDTSVDSEIFDLVLEKTFKSVDITTISSSTYFNNNL